MSKKRVHRSAPTNNSTLQKIDHRDCNAAVVLVRLRRRYDRLRRDLKSATAALRSFEAAFRKRNTVAFEDVPLSSMGLSTRTLNCISNLPGEPQTATDLLRHGHHHLVRARNVGRKTLKEIEDRFAMLGVSLPERCKPGCLSYNDRGEWIPYDRWDHRKKVDE